MMKRRTYFILFFLLSTAAVVGQEKGHAETDAVLKETLYKKYKREAQRFDKKAFDALFFDFFQKQNAKEVLLTKEEFYGYTIKIAAYAEKLGLLYKEQKKEAEMTKREWYEKQYSDYLQLKKQ
jgi:hypothetical protein